MNKKEITLELYRLDSIGVSRDDYIVTYGAALVLQGVKLETSDIDIYCPTTSVIKLLALKGYESIPFGTGAMTKVGDNMDFHFVPMLVTPKIKKIDGFQVQTVQSVYDEKEKHGRDKDIRDLLIIKEWLSNH